jgi:hypothetical protein
MIVKFLSHQRTNYKNVVNYVLSGFLNDKDSFAIFHNVSSTDIREVAKEFRENAKLKPKRKNGIVLKHFIQSYSPLDSAVLTRGKLEDMAHKLIESFCPNNQVVAGLHMDKKHIHVHFMVSSNEYLSSKAHRLGEKEFVKALAGLEQYQLEKYPEIQHSFAYLEEKKKELNQEKAKPKNKAETRKENLKILVKEIFDKSKGKTNFIERLKAKNLVTYDYRGKFRGVWSENKKYRLKTLGINSEHLQTLERMDELTRLSYRNTDRNNELER